VWGGKEDIEAVKEFDSLTGHLSNDHGPDDVDRITKFDEYL
jgi:hypothetical protein